MRSVSGEGAEDAPRRDGSLGNDFIQHSLPTAMFGVADVLVPTSSIKFGGGLGVVVGQLGPQPIVRIQSKCAYGELLTSRLCDCRLQLVRSGEILGRAGGVLIHLEQEGRGLGPSVKAAAYRALEERGIDSYAYYREQGLPVDTRKYDLAIAILRELEVNSLRLLTNNPLKVAALVSEGFSVERVSIEVDADPLARRYLDSKVSEGHMLSLREE